MTFSEFLTDAAQRGELLNTVFEQRLFELLGTLKKIADALDSERIPHELVGDWRYLPT